MNVDLVERIWRKDTSLWSAEEPEKQAIANRLGWLSAADFFKREREGLIDFSKQVLERRFTHVVLLGMGGSSLCPYLFSSIFGSASDFPELLVLDSTDPDYIRQVQADVDISRTLFIMASKSGGTIEPNCLFEYFYEQLAQLEASPGQNFLAITDKDTSLVQLARDREFWRTFINPGDIGGRYSALSFFGLIPAAAIGMDLAALFESFKAMETACKSQADIDTNPALTLADYMASNVACDRDKLTLLLDTRLAPFGLWLEQLLAESTGKKETGVIPIVGEPQGKVSDYGTDRFFVSIGLQGHEEDTRLGLTKQLKEAGIPVKEYTFESAYQLGGEFLRWELAVAICGHLLKVNPFDEPNVTESKENTGRILSYYNANAKMPFEFSGEKYGWRWRYSPSLCEFLEPATGQDLAAGLGQFFAHIAKNGYFGLLTYLPHQAEVEEISRQLRVVIRKRLGCATVFGFGPRYLHASGQQHKGGPANGAYLIITRDEKNGLVIPDRPYTFGQLQFAQALGDFQSLTDKGRLAIHLHLNSDYLHSLSSVLRLIRESLPWGK